MILNNLLLANIATSFPTTPQPQKQHETLKASLKMNVNTKVCEIVSLIESTQTHKLVRDFNDIIIDRFREGSYESGHTEFITVYASSAHRVEQEISKVCTGFKQIQVSPLKAAPNTDETVF
jgi:hypothetical protein